MRAALPCLIAFGFCAAAAVADAPTAPGGRLGEALRAAGYEPAAAGDGAWQVTIDRGGWKVHTLLSITADPGRVWLECKFPPITDPEAVPAAAWRRLMEENGRISPAHFAFDPTDRRVHLYLAVSAEALAPEHLRAAVDGFDRTARGTQAVWRAENFRGPPETLTASPREVVPLDAAAELGRLQGTWRVFALEMRGQRASDEQLAAVRPAFIVEGDTAVLQSGPDVEKVTRIRLGGTAEAPQIDFIDNRKRVERGIYRLTGDELRICFAAPDEDRPAAFATDSSRTHWLLTLRREKR